MRKPNTAFTAGQNFAQRPPKLNLLSMGDQLLSGHLFYGMNFLVGNKQLSKDRLLISSYSTQGISSIFFLIGKYDICVCVHLSVYVSLRQYILIFFYCIFKVTRID